MVRTAQITWNQIFSNEIWATFICGSKSDTDRFFFKSDLSLNRHVTHIRSQSDFDISLDWCLSLLCTGGNYKQKQTWQTTTEVVSGGTVRLEIWWVFGVTLMTKQNTRGHTVTGLCLNVFSTKWPKGDTEERGFGVSRKFRAQPI